MLATVLTLASGAAEEESSNFLVSGVASAKGGGGDDALSGTANLGAGNLLEGGAGDDALSGLKGWDTLRGGPGDDALTPGEGGSGTGTEVAEGGDETQDTISFADLTTAHAISFDGVATALLMENIEVDPSDVYPLQPPLGMSSLWALMALNRPELKDPAFVPSVPPQLRDVKTSEELFAAIRKGDILLHHPYDSFLPVVQFIRNAAMDPAVLAIKQTLYRIGKELSADLELRVVLAHALSHACAALGAERLVEVPTAGRIDRDQLDRGAVGAIVAAP